MFLLNCFLIQTTRFYLLEKCGNRPVTRLDGYSNIEFIPSQIHSYRESDSIFLQDFQPFQRYRPYRTLQIHPQRLCSSPEYESV